MSRSSKQIAINFPNELLAVYGKCLPWNLFRDFVREAVGEKLRSDFRKKVPKKYMTRKRGQRVDLRDPDEETHEKMVAQAEWARRYRAHSANILPGADCVDSARNPHQDDCTQLKLDNHRGPLPWEGREGP